MLLSDCCRPLLRHLRHALICALGAGFAATGAQAHELGRHVYKGTVANMPVTLFMDVQESCDPDQTTVLAMYRYDGKSKWLELAVTEGENGQFAMVEHRFTGLMVLAQDELAGTLEGSWLSPDQKRKLPVKLLETEVPSKEIERLQDALDKVLHENNDC